MIKEKNQTHQVLELIKSTLDISNYKIAKDLGFTESSVSSWGKTVNSAQYNSIAKVIKFYKLHKNKEFQEAFWKLM